MTEINARSLTANEWPEVLKFLNRQLRPGLTWSIADEYPTVFKDSNRSNLKIISDGDAVLSHAALRPLIHRAPWGLTRIGTIGSVITDEKYRGEGHATETLNECLRAAQAQACDLALLWTDQYDFYRKLGFELAGYEWTYEIDERFVAGPRAMGLRIENTPRVSAEALLRVFHKHTVNSVRTLPEIESLLKIPQTTVLTLWSPEQKLLAYAIEGKGLDLTDYVHEWGGNVSHVILLFEELRRLKGRNIRLLVPHHAQQMRKTLDERSVTKFTGYLGMWQILNHDHLAQKVNRHVRALGETFSFVVAENHWRLVGLEKEYELEGSPTLCRFLFGPETAEDLASFTAADTARLNKIFPLPIWVWGWDSI